MGHEDVYEAVAYGFENDSSPTKIGALVTAKRGIEIEQIYKFFRQNAPEYLLPDRFLVLDKFPKTEAGKIDRPRVIKEAHAKYDR